MSSNPPTTKMQPTQKTEADAGQTSKTASNQPPAMLEEDDEFEDFPVEDWSQEDTEVPGGTTHLWEESWDDDDENEDFSKQLKGGVEEGRSEQIEPLVTKALHCMASGFPEGSIKA